MSPGALPKSSNKPNVSPGSGDDGENDVDQVVEHYDNRRDPEDGPQMPGAYPPAGGPGRVGVYPQPGRLHPRLVDPFGPAPVEPIAPRVTTGAPVVRPPRGIRGVRLGYAARGAYAGRGIGQILVEAQRDTVEEQPETQGAFRGRVLAGGFRGLPPRGRGGAPGTNENPADSSPVDD